MVFITFTSYIVSSGISVQFLALCGRFHIKNIVILFFYCIYITVNEDDATNILQANPYLRKLVSDKWASPQNSQKWSITKTCSTSLIKFITLCLPSCSYSFILHSFKLTNLTLFEFLVMHFHL